MLLSVTMFDFAKKY